MNLGKFYKNKKLKILYLPLRKFWKCEIKVGVKNDFNKFYKF